MKSLPLFICLEFQNEPVGRHVELFRRQHMQICRVPKARNYRSEAAVPMVFDESQDLFLGHFKQRFDATFITSNYFSSVLAGQRCNRAFTIATQNLWGKRFRKWIWFPAHKTPKAARLSLSAQVNAHVNLVNNFVVWAASLPISSFLSASNHRNGGAVALRSPHQPLC